METVKKPLPKRTITDLLSEQGLITQKQLEYAKRIQSKLPGSPSLLSILKELGYIDDKTISNAIGQSRDLHLPLGELLVELGQITKADLERALAIQREHPEKRIGQILIDNNSINENKLYELIACQMGFPLVELDDFEPDESFFRPASFRIFKENDFIPLKRNQDGSVDVVFADPLNKTNCEAAKQIFNQINKAIAPQSAIRAALSSVSMKTRKQADANSSGENTVVRMVDDIILDALKKGASDIHLEPMKNRFRVRYRLDGVLIPQEDIDFAHRMAVTSRLKVLSGADIAEKRRHQDGRILFGSADNPVDIRVSFYSTVHGEKIVMRLLNRQATLLDINSIGLAPRQIQIFKDEVLDAPSGVVLITGPTGSGKTTTLYAAVQYLNNVNTSIITAEDPAEYIIDGISQCSINPKINVTFEDTLKHIVRQDPDVIVIGEIRDRFSAETAIQAALTGHKVLTTFHTEDTIGGLLRLLNMNIEAFLISSTVVCVLAQRLLRKVCPDCGRQHKLSSDELRRLRYDPMKEKNLVFARGSGCPNCNFTGYRGRIVVTELLVLNEDVKNALIMRKTSYEIRRISIETSGLVTLLEDGIVKASKGLTSFEEIIRMLPRLDRPRPVSQLRRIQGIYS